jgi:hypothetical protein
MRLGGNCLVTRTAIRLENQYYFEQIMRINMPGGGQKILKYKANERMRDNEFDEDGMDPRAVAILGDNYRKESYENTEYGDINKDLDIEWGIDDNDGNPIMGIMLELVEEI